MSETFYSTREDATVFQIAWSGLDTWPAHWQRLLEILRALDGERESLGELRGTLEVDGAEWPIDGDLAARAGAAPELLGGMIACYPLALVDDGELTAIDWDSDDLFALGQFPLVATAEPQRFRITGGPQHAASEPPLFLRLGFEISQWAQQITLDVSSRFDLWRPTRFDGTPSPTGARNEAWLRTVFDRIR